MVQPSDVMKMRVLQARARYGKLSGSHRCRGRYKIIPERFDARDLIYQGALK